MEADCYDDVETSIIKMEKIMPLVLLMKLSVIRASLISSTRMFFFLCGDDYDNYYIIYLSTYSYFFVYFILVLDCSLIL